MKRFTRSKLWIGCIVLAAAAIMGWAANKIEKIDKDKILAHGEEWQSIYNNFAADHGLFEAVATKAGEDLKIDVYLGLWCSDSKNNVPRFLKIITVIESINGSGPVVNYYNVERKPSKDVKYFVEELKVERVPTFIFSRDGKEIGRIIENPKKSLLEDFMEIVF